MHSNMNVRLLNKDQKQGNVANYFERLSELVQVNDGTRSFQLRTVDCHDQAAPFNSSQETRIAITHSDHQISQITDGFLTFRVKLTLQLTGIDPNFSDKDHLCKIFVGFKSSNQILDQLQILCRNLSTDFIPTSTTFPSVGLIELATLEIIGLNGLITLLFTTFAASCITLPAFRNPFFILFQSPQAISNK